MVSQVLVAPPLLCVSLHQTVRVFPWWQQLYSTQVTGQPQLRATQRAGLLLCLSTVSCSWYLSCISDYTLTADVMRLGWGEHGTADCRGQAR